jgi:hypothetical protein
VGSYSTWHPFIEAWNGNSWTIDATPTLATSAILNSVSCVNVADCVAVGEIISTESDVALIETWNGKTWSLSKTPSAGENSTLNAVSCVTSQCIAVGTELNKNGNGGLIEVRSHGKWLKVKDATENDALTGISCVTPAECMAVGGGPFAQMWNGATWSDTSPIAQDHNSNFNGVSCVPAGDCFAVGTYTTKANPEHPGKVYGLVEQWNGETWALMGGTSAPPLESISCINADQCSAVGGSPLIQLWNGAAWSQATAETPPGNEGYFGFTSVSCLTSDASCTAVGSYDSSRPLVETGNLPDSSGYRTLNTFGALNLTERSPSRA